MAFRELLHQAFTHGGRAAVITEEAHLATTPRVGNRHRNLLLRCIQTDENFAILLHCSSSLCVRVCAGLFRATPARHILQDEPPARPRTYGLGGRARSFEGVTLCSSTSP